MTNGFTRPFSPTGAASIVPALPWRFGGDLYIIHFRTRAESLASYLPRPLEPSNTPDEAFVWTTDFAVYPHEDGAEQTMNPFRTNYNVCVIGIPCKLHGENTMLSAFQWCDRDWLVVTSWFLGSCSKLADIEQSGIHPLISAQGSPQTGDMGTRINRTVSRNGERIVTMSVTPREFIKMEDLSFYTGNLPLTSERHFPDVHYPKKGKPEIHDLAQMLSTGMQTGEIRKGDASLEFHPADNEELLPIQPTEVLGGYIMPFSWLLQGIKIVHNYLG